MYVFPHSRGAPPMPPTAPWGGLFEAFLHVKFYVRKKSAKVAPSWSQDASKSPKLLPRAPKRPQKSIPGRVRRVFRSRFRRKTAKPHQTLLFTIQKPHPRTSENHFFRRFSGPKRCEKALCKKMSVKLLKNVAESAPEAP